MKNLVYSRICKYETLIDRTLANGRNSRNVKYYSAYRCFAYTIKEYEKEKNFKSLKINLMIAFNWFIQKKLPKGLEIELKLFITQMDSISSLGQIDSIIDRALELTECLKDRR